MRPAQRCRWTELTPASTRDHLPVAAGAFVTCEDARQHGAASNPKPLPLMTTSLTQPRLRILLVDTDRDIFTHLTLLLDEIAPRQFTLGWAQTYAFAETAMRRQPYELCLVSTRIGHRSGNELAKHLRTNYPRTPVIMLAGREELLEPGDFEQLDCLDRHHLTATMLRQTLRDSLFRAAGAPLPASQAQPAASESAGAAA